MSKLNVLIDSATKRSSSDNKYGESVVAWAAWWGNSFDKKPIKCGIHYFRYEGPNKVFYEGIISILEQCTSLIKKDDELIILGDCNPVVDQLNGKRRVEQMEKYFRKVKLLKLRFSNGVTFRHIDRNNSLYKKIDQLAKRSRTHITNILK